mmetsp:Transcript_24033/g.35760  ORF Transcript_24033/g.35760 Transcript_24033/m.35760 type:complete len:557 (-) Transcript_24033:249-1919(-)|eukprot:CAMPEP_0203681586 /NCGR_PEP_ID=MMETSP0090-20130426/43173_1 /ASSEMBLY_ACC=CAM_ASM_001088 /TAXON_ID=426623 /ORGANISM="Chaetoceros affinis, Strain CCMP159" /LENGTH=556 /DNA_ID=CAMNT_0050550127 /DNA_START=202 /DNA_END=1872 /DNA_ORIENTATION=-
MKAETTKKSKQQKKKSKKDSNPIKKQMNSSGSKKEDGKDTAKDATKDTTSSSRLQIGPFYYIVAILSFVAGVYTPSLYSQYSTIFATVTNIHRTNNATTIATTNVTATNEINEGSSSAKETEAATTTSSISKKSNSRRKYVECNDHHLSQFLHDEPIKGLHVLCFPTPDEQEQHDQEGDVDQNPQMMKIYKYAYSTSSGSATSATDKDILQHDVPASFEELKEYLSTAVNVEMYSRQSVKQPWAIYSTLGKKLVREYDRDVSIEKSEGVSENSSSSISSIIDKLQKHGMVLLFEGGSWLWPGVRIGFERTIEIYDHDNGKKSSATDTSIQSQNITLETLSLFPLVLSVKDFISEEECTHVQRKAEPNMQYSGVTLMDRDQGRPASDFRTSQSAFVNSVNDHIMTRLEHRTASLTRVPRVHQEYTQVLRYGKEEKYDAHLDWFDRELYKQDKNTLKLIDNGRTNRLATVFWYLSDVEEGGHTNFPRFNKGPQPWDFTDCSKGLSVKPQRGKVIIFYSLTADGVGDALSLHGACKVEKGIKWAANKWIWNTPQSFIRN